MYIKLILFRFACILYPISKFFTCHLTFETFVSAICTFDGYYSVFNLEGLCTNKSSDGSTIDTSPPYIMKDIELIPGTGSITANYQVQFQLSR